MRPRIKYLSAILIAVVAVVGIAKAVIDLSQTAPVSPTIPASTAITASTCNSSSTPLAYPSTMPAGPATVSLTCSAATAFSVTQVGTDVPTFTLPSPANSLAISTAATCTSPIALTSGTSVTFSATASYFYCVGYPAVSTATTIATFTIAWAT